MEILKRTFTATTGNTGNIALNIAITEEPLRVTVVGYICSLFWSNTWFIKVLSNTMTIVSNTEVTYTVATFNLVSVVN